VRQGGKKKGKKNARRKGGTSSNVSPEERGKEEFSFVGNGRLRFLKGAEAHFNQQNGRHRRGSVSPVGKEKEEGQ